MSSSSAGPTMTLKYLALPHGLGGRGGVLRFFLLANNISFQEKLIELSDWPAEKERLVASQENPCGSVPVVYLTQDNDKTVPLIQHIATARYLAKLHGKVTTTDYEAYVQDLVADEYQGFRDAWVHVAFSGTDEEKATYKGEPLTKYLTKFEALYAKYKTHAVFLSVTAKTEMPLWGDAAMYGLLRDHLLTGMVSEEAMKETYPHLWKMYEAFAEIPAVMKWCDSKKE